MRTLVQFVRYDLKLIHELCGELGLRSRIVSDESVEVDLGGDAILCFCNAALEKDCLIEFRDTPWHQHDDFLPTDCRGHYLVLDYLDLLTGLKEGKVLVCERWKSGLLEDRWLIHSEFNCECRYIRQGEELRVWRAPR
jgi:hypothetical protein